MTEIEVLVDREEMDEIIQLRDRLRVGDRVYYPVASADADVRPSRRRTIPCRIVRKYPNLVEVAGGAWRSLPVRTISYAEMLSVPGALGRKGDKDV